MHQKHPPAKYALFFSVANTELEIIKLNNINMKDLIIMRLIQKRQIESISLKVATLSSLPLIILEFFIFSYI
tara:strand:- start:5065 stop:5280 length:216 start_codon:yes stop_codon:yes gene_type:complete